MSDFLQPHGLQHTRLPCLHYLLELLKVMSSDLMLLLLSHFSCVQLCATLWTVARQAPVSKGLSKQEYWSGLPFPSPGNLPNPETELSLLCFLHWQVDYLPMNHLGSPV